MDRQSFGTNTLISVGIGKEKEETSTGYTMNRIKLLFIIGIFFVVLLASGCISEKAIVENQKKSNYVLPTIRYKQNVEAAWGQGSAIYDGALYYHDVKGDIAGIYKQDLSSGAEELLIETDSIRKLQVTEEGIYYIGRTKNKDIEIQEANAR